MKKKNGFIFVETMIVIVVLITSLLLIYISYSGVIANEKRRQRYDDPAYIYKTYNIAKFLINLGSYSNNGINGIKDIMTQLPDCDGKSCIYPINSESGDNDAELFGISDLTDNRTRRSFYVTMVSEFNADNILLVHKTSNFNEFIQTEEMKEYGEMIKYLKTLKDGWYMAVEYSEKSNGDDCSMEEHLTSDSGKNTICSLYYASIKVG